MFNPGKERKSVSVMLDPRSGVTAKSRLFDVLLGKSSKWNGKSFRLELGPEDVGVYRIHNE